jgi:aminocarboxymuconate-semialdehyde decarboxylase
MPTRRNFCGVLAGAAGAALFSTHQPVRAWRQPQGVGGRRGVRVGGRRVTVVDMHGHCLVRDVLPLVKGTPLERGLDIPDSLTLAPERIQVIDEQGIDIQVLSINAFWYAAPEPLARDIIRVQNEALARWCAQHPTRFVGFASVALQFPALAAQQLEEGVTKLGLKGAAIGGSVEGRELSDRAFDPFWAKAEELGVPIFMHPQPAPGTTTNPRLSGKGALGNTIGNPLETSVALSHLIFEGTLDRYPRLKLCAAHGGGYLTSYLGRSDAACTRQPNACDGKGKAIDAYFKDQILVDSMVFRHEGLRHLVAEVGVGQVVFGTDIPYNWPATVDFVLQAPFLDDAQKEAILGKNALALLRIPAPALPG